MFSGSGTVAVESKLLERNFIGCEINPLSAFISNVKTYSYNIDILNDFNKQIEDNLYNSEYTKNLKKGKNVILDSINNNITAFCFIF